MKLVGTRKRKACDLQGCNGGGVVEADANADRTVEADTQYGFVSFL